MPLKLLPPNPFNKVTVFMKVPSRVLLFEFGWQGGQWLLSMTCNQQYCICMQEALPASLFIQNEYTLLFFTIYEKQNLHLSGHGKQIADLIL